MGVDIETYRGRFGTFKFAFGVDVIILQCTLNFSGCLKAVGSLVFIGILLLMAGIEQNPGPTERGNSSADEEVTESADNKLKTYIDKAWGKLVDYMIPDPILDSSVFEFRERRDIMEEKNTSEKNRGILKKFRSQGAIGYKSLRTCLVDTKQILLVKLLECIEKGEDTSLLEKQLQDEVMKITRKVIIVDGKSDAGEKQFADKIVMKVQLEGRLPSALELAVLCQTYGRKSSKVKHVCDTICNHIKEECKHIVNVWPSYRPCEENIIVFCVITDIPCERIICPYSVVQRAIGEYSIEEREILKQELNSGLDFTDDAVEVCIQNNAEKFMDNHKYLSVMSAGLLKSEKFATSLEKVSQQVCIVLLVLIKGFIPLSEEAFPKYVGDFPVDVREGNFRYKFGGKPNDRHESLKMGCAIHGILGDELGGTLGGFLDHSEHGICCLTCTHVLLNVTKMKRTFPGQYIPESSELCYQPEPPNAFGFHFKAIATDGDEDISGMDVALVKIHEGIPLNGRFPDAKNEKWLEAGYSPTLEMQYTTGNVLVMSENRGKLVLKYGQATTITEGDPFSKDGDSGALVFVRGNDCQFVAIGILVGGTDSYDVVTPIYDILRELATA